MKRQKRKRRTDSHSVQQDRTLANRTDIAPIELIGEIADKPSAKVIALRSVRNDPLARIHAQKKITDLQYAAAREYQSLHDRSQRGRIQAMDYERPFIDGRAAGETILDGQMRATDTLRQINVALGENGLSWVTDILVTGMNLREACAKRGRFDKTYQRFAGVHLAECLDVIAAKLGMMTQPQPPISVAA